MVNMWRLWSVGSRNILANYKVLRIDADGGRRHVARRSKNPDGDSIR